MAIRLPRSVLNFGSTVLYVWLASNLAFSNGSVAPELAILGQAKSFKEFPILKRIQDLTLDLQLLEITIKNRRDQQVEERISAALNDIEREGAELTQNFRIVREEQLQSLSNLLSMIRPEAFGMGVTASQWEEILLKLREGPNTPNTIAVHSKKGPLNILKLTPLYLGHQVVWNVTLPVSDSRSFWMKAKIRTGAKSPILRLVDQINKDFLTTETLARNYHTQSYERLYSAFESHRFAILQRVSLARRALNELAQSTSAMSTPEEYAQLYNQTIESLYTYGVDVSLSGLQRDFSIKGFLFGDTPEHAAQFMQRLKLAPGTGNFNSPSS